MNRKSDAALLMMHLTSLLFPLNEKRKMHLAVGDSYLDDVISLIA